MIVTLSKTEQVEVILQAAKRLGRGTYANRIRQYESFKKQLNEMVLSASEYTQAVRELADVLKV